MLIVLKKSIRNNTCEIKIKIRIRDKSKPGEYIGLLCFFEKGGTRPSLCMIDACGLLLTCILELSFAKKNYIMGRTGSIHVSTI
jgi:hypothetical protein